MCFFMVFYIKLKCIPNSIQIYFIQVWHVESWKGPVPVLTMFMRQVLPSSPGVSRGVRSREPRREPPPGQSTWSRETLRALFPFTWLHVKWVFAYWEDQDPPRGEGSTQPPLNSTLGHTYTALTVFTFVTLSMSVAISSGSSVSYATV